MTTIAMADDHILLRNGLAGLIESFGDYKIVLQANNGKELTQKIGAMPMPDLVLLDISMPEMDGFATAAWLKKNYPNIKVLALSMMDHEDAIVQMIRNGARGYVLKDAEPEELRNALYNIIHKGFHYSELVSGKLVYKLQNIDQSNSLKGISLTEREKEFLPYTCTELTYKEIAHKMGLSNRTVDGYRDDLFDKLGVKSRVGLALYAIKMGLVQL